MLQLIIIGFGGFFGAIARYWLSGFVMRSFDTNFPHGTLAVNVFGCFALGFLMTIFDERVFVNTELRSFLTIGFLGALTTFSTFGFETISLLKAQEFVAAFANIGASLLLGLIAVYFGIVSAKAV